ncbi:MAG: hypothetical protein IJE03_07100, partial [Ruminiclostridium sp.]|nr:hypothetical protein [Ruminiclostridium sp.]
LKDGRSAGWKYSVVKLSNVTLGETTKAVTVADMDASTDALNITYNISDELNAVPQSELTLGKDPAEGETPEPEQTITLEQKFTQITGEEEKAIALGEDYILVLTPAEGYVLPEIIKVTIGDTTYEVYTDGQEHREIPEGQTAEDLPLMPAFDPETNTLTIPKDLLVSLDQAVTIEAQAVKLPEPPAEQQETGLGETIQSVVENVVDAVKDALR